MGSDSKLRRLAEEEIPPIVINGVALPYVNMTKCLGLQLSNNLSWNNDVSQVTRKVNSALHSLKVRKNIYSTDIRRLVSATILPLIDYCYVVLIDATCDNDLKLQRTVNSSIRFIFGLRRDEHITAYRRELGWLSVKYRRLYFLLCYFYKLLEVGKPGYLRDAFFEETDVRRSSRSVAKKHTVFKLPHFATTYLERSFIVTAIRVWEELPDDIVNSSSLEVFRNKIFDHLLNLDN